MRRATPRWGLRDWAVAAAGAAVELVAVATARAPADDG
jgi:hypothetical protein